MRQYESEPMAGDPFIIFVKQVHFFHQILEQAHLDEFEQLIYPQERKLKIFCKTAANFLNKQMKGFHSVIAQSATLYPVGYYREMLGFPQESEILWYPSPFPMKNRLYMDFPDVSTRYNDRNSSFMHIAKLIHESIQIESGNYLVFFPSFSYLFSVLKELKKFPLTNELIIQQRRMNEKQRKRVLQKLKSGFAPYLLLAVHGGIFSEGVDYLGKMAIGAFIISPGLPQFCYEQELMKNYFQKQFLRGFEFAYRNPGLTRVIQAAGRIFRSETDKGFVILIGQRFHTNYYRDILPKDWDIETPTSIPDRIRKFWYN
jgi:DNA excision repair protein ERCC-2